MLIVIFLGSFGFFCIILGYFEFFWVLLGSFGFFQVPLGSFGFLWVPLDSFGFIYLGSLGFLRVHLGVDTVIGGLTAEPKNLKTPFFSRFSKSLLISHWNWSKNAPVFFFLKNLNKYGP